MPRKLSITVPSDVSQSVIDQAKDIEGIGCIQLQKGVSVQPPGDVVIVEGTNDAAMELVYWCKEHDIGPSTSSGISTSEPSSLISKQINQEMNNEKNEALLEEIEAFLHKPTSGTINTYMIMLGAGIFAATGIMTDAIHLAIAGFILAPGFQPLLIITFGLVYRTSIWKQGVQKSLLMYLALMVGAVVTGYALQWMDYSVTGGKAAYLHEAGTLISYWSQLTPAGYYIAAAAGFCGTFIVTTRQPSLVPSVTVAAALVPSMAIVGLGVSSGDLDLAGTAFIRWSSEVLILLVFSALAFLLKKKITHKRALVH